MSLLEIQQVSKSFADHVVVDNISLKIEQGEFFTLLGPSGCGKTTLLRMIAGFAIPNSGKILLDGRDITTLAPEDRPLHTIFQSYALFPHMTVFDNVAFSLRMAKLDKKKIKEQVDELLEDVRLSKFADRYPSGLSGGQKQRVAIARSLVDRPKLLLLDEPLSALDARLRQHMHVELVKLQEETEITFVYVTHDQEEALALSSRIAVMNQGHIEQLDTPAKIYSKPKTYFVADFLGKCNVFRAEVMAINGTTLSLKIADMLEFTLDDVDVSALKVGQIGWYFIRPEKMQVSKQIPENSIQVVIKTRVNGYYYYGDVTLYEFILTQYDKFQVMLTNSKPTQVEFFVDDTEVYVSFDSNTGNFLAE